MNIAHSVPTAIGTPIPLQLRLRQTLQPNVTMLTAALWLIRDNCCHVASVRAAIIKGD